MRTTYLKDCQPSPLALDLWLTGTSLAALKTKSNVSPSKEDFRSVNCLAEHFHKELDLFAGTPHIPSNVVPQKTLREDLEQAFAILTPGPAPADRGEHGLLQKLAKLLDRFVKQHSLSPRDATDLLEAISELNRRKVETPNVPDLHV